MTPTDPADQLVKSAPKGFILSNAITHKRFIPTTHHFVYRTVSLLVSLDDLEQRRLDIADGWLFGYGSRANVCGIRHQAYLAEPTTPSGPSPAPLPTIRQRLEALLCQRSWNPDDIGDVWLATMPSFLGFEGINPLTVYYIYKKKAADHVLSLWLVVLEVHNTYGEKHVYILETGVSEEAPNDTSTQVGFDHTWIFPRQFHVSPFNDRSGFYRCLIKAIPPPSECTDSTPPPRPIVKLELLTKTEPRQRKLLAIISTVSSTPLSATSLLRRIAEAPFGLLLTLPRITYQAFLLHFRKRLDVYPRPEPVSQLRSTEDRMDKDGNTVEGPIEPITGAIGWQGESILERWARKRLEAFLTEGTQGTSVTLVSSDPAAPPRTFGPPSSKKTLVIAYRSPKFFTVMIMAPSALHALLLGSDTERIFTPSSRDIFLDVFSHATRESTPTFARSLVQRIRLARIPPEVLAQHPIPRGGEEANPLGCGSPVVLLIAIALLFLQDWAEAMIFAATGARFVRGSEPWKGWERLSANFKMENNEIGSVLRGM